MSTITDTDMEVLEQDATCTEHDNETCQRCGRNGLSITLLRAGRAGNRLESYECLCGQVSAWYNSSRIA